MEPDTLDSNLFPEDKTLKEEDIANSGRRFLNFIIDSVAIYLIYFAILIPSLSTGLFGVETVGLPFLIYLIMLAYYIIFEATTGKTLGKYITNTHVVTINGEKPTFKTALYRALCRFIPFDAFSFFGSPSEGWHDTIAKSRVVFD